MFVSVMTDLINLITPTYNLSCVWVCHWVQAVLSRKSSQSALSKLHITTRISLRKETCSLTATIAKIIPENHRLCLKSLRLKNKDGNAGRRHTVADNGTRSEDLLGGEVQRERNTRLQVKVSGDKQRQNTNYFLTAWHRTNSNGTNFMFSPPA
jgi:hypothetical protein